MNIFYVVLKVDLLKKASKLYFIIIPKIRLVHNSICHVRTNKYQIKHKIYLCMNLSVLIYLFKSFKRLQVFLIILKKICFSIIFSVFLFSVPLK